MPLGTLGGVRGHRYKVSGKPYATETIQPRTPSDRSAFEMQPSSVVGGPIISTDNLAMS